MLTVIMMEYWLDLQKPPLLPHCGQLLTLQSSWRRDTMTARAWVYIVIQKEYCYPCSYLWAWEQGYILPSISMLQHEKLGTWLSITHCSNDVQIYTFQLYMCMHASSLGVDLYSTPASMTEHNTYYMDHVDLVHLYTVYHLVSATNCCICEYTLNSILLSFKREFSCMHVMRKKWVGERFKKTLQVWVFHVRSVLMAWRRNSSSLLTSYRLCSSQNSLL